MEQDAQTPPTAQTDTAPAAQSGTLDDFITQHAAEFDRMTNGAQGAAQPGAQTPQAPDNATLARELADLKAKDSMREQRAAEADYGKLQGMLRDSSDVLKGASDRMLNLMLGGLVREKGEPLLKAYEIARGDPAKMEALIKQVVPDLETELKSIQGANIAATRKSIVNAGRQQSAPKSSKLSRSDVRNMSADEFVKTFGRV